jgi:hypothetical protein
MRMNVERSDKFLVQIGNNPDIRYNIYLLLGNNAEQKSFTRQTQKVL